MIRRRVTLTFSRGSLAQYSRFKGLSIGGVILALQGYSGIHIGIDNLKCSSWSRCIALPGGNSYPSLSWLKDGDLLATIHSMLCRRGMDTVEVSKVRGSCYSNHG